jgi:hypothetical protein
MQGGLYLMQTRTGELHNNDFDSHKYRNAVRNTLIVND